MTQEERKLLFIDICGRLPYKVRASYWGGAEECECWDVVDQICLDYDHEVGIGQYELSIEEVKPYLFPLSSMTKEIEDEIYRETGLYDIFEDNQIHIEVSTNFSDVCKLFNILNKYHLDYNGLIPRGLANDATGLNIYSY